MADDEVVNLDKERLLRDFVEARRKYPALTAGYKPVEDLVDWYLEGGYTHEDMLHAFAYSAAAQIFRDVEPKEAESHVRACFELILFDLLHRGPHYGDEEY
jgi:hypothetical protein